MAAPALGTIAGATVHVADPGQANRLYNKGWLGVPQSGNSLQLEAEEAAWAVAQGRLKVTDGQREWQPADLLGLREGAEVAYLAFTDLRARGLVCRPHKPKDEMEGAFGASLDLWERGQHPPADPAMQVVCHAERDQVTAAQVIEMGVQSVVLAIADEDGALTYYSTQLDAPTGTVPMPSMPREAPFVAHVLADRVMVPGDGAQAWLKQAAIGTPHAGAAILSFTEAAFLATLGILDVPDLVHQARTRQRHFEKTRPVYDCLREAHSVARSGYRFGTHLRVYTGHPDDDHATWLVQCFHDDDVLLWNDVSRGVRLAHGVRKRYLLAASQGDKQSVRFAWLNWYRP